MSNQAVTFQEALEIVESLSEYQQENLLDIIRHRLRDHRRQLLAERIKEARQEYARGEVRKGNVADLMKEVSE
jgi:cation transport regulator ChaB